METIQIPLNNQQKPVPNIRTRTFFIVNAELDDVLRSGLDELIRKHWRKLGARIHKRASDGRFEYRLPKTFAEDYELFRWSEEERSHTIDEESGISVKPPSNDSSVTFLPGGKHLDEAFRPQHWPFNLEHDPVDGPMLYLHVIHYSDATVIVISFPHILGDQFGLTNVVKAWMSVIQGKQPPAMVGYDEDVIPDKAYNSYIKDKIVRKGRVRVRRPMEYFFVLLPFIPELAFQRQEEGVTMFFPEGMIASLKQKFVKELTAEYGADPGISSGDVLTAILTKFGRMARKKKDTLSLSQTVNLRGRIPKLTGSGSEGYVHNSLHYATARFPISPSTPLKEIAYRNRLAINQGIQPEDVEIGMSVVREMTRRGQGLHICEPFDRSYSITSWGGVWTSLDFSPAVKQAEKTDKTDKMSAASSTSTEGARKLDLLVLGQGKEQKTPARFHSTIMDKSGGGYWIDFSATPKTMKAIRAHLAKDPLLEKL